MGCPWNLGGTWVLFVSPATERTLPTEFPVLVGYLVHNRYSESMHVCVYMYPVHLHVCVYIYRVGLHIFSWRSLAAETVRSGCQAPRISLHSSPARLENPSIPTQAEVRTCLGHCFRCQKSLLRGLQRGSQVRGSPFLFPILLHRETRAGVPKDLDNQEVDGEHKDRAL